MDKLILKFKNRKIKEYELTGKPIKIGREEDCEITIDNAAVSRHHAEIEFKNNEYTLADLNSTNGTFVNKKKIKKIKLCAGDEITIGKHIMVFESDRKSEGASMNDFSATMILDTQQQRELLTKQRKSPSTEHVAKQAKLIVFQSGKRKEHLLTKDTTVIGKSASADVILKGFMVPQMAATIKKEADSYCITGYGGWISVFVNGRVVGKKWKLYSNDTIEVRKNKIIFQLE